MSVCMLYNLKHQTTPRQLSPQQGDFSLPKARPRWFTNCISNCRSHLLLRNSPADNPGGHCQFGVGCFLSEMQTSSSSYASLAETQPSGTQELIFQNESRAVTGTSPTDYHLCSFFPLYFYFPTCFHGFSSVPASIQPCSRQQHTFPFTSTHHHHHRVCVLDPVSFLFQKARETIGTTTTKRVVLSILSRGEIMLLIRDLPLSGPAAGASFPPTDRAQTSSCWVG